MIADHVAAFRALLEAAGLIVYDAESPPLTSGGYVTLYTDDGGREQVDLANDNPQRVWTIQTTCNGADALQARWFADAVEAAVEGVRPVIAGRNCSPIRRHITRPIERDDDVQPARFYAVSQWRWYSTTSA